MRGRWLGAAFVAAGVTFQFLWLGLPAIGFSVLLLASFGIWSAGQWRVVPRLRWATWLGVLVYGAHVAEEVFGGLPRALPALFQSAAWSDTRFLAFNGVWFLLFVVAALTVRPGRELSGFLAVFLAVGVGAANGVLHFLVALQQGAYFPGLWTAPLNLAVGIWLLRLLFSSPRPRAV